MGCATAPQAARPAAARLAPPLGKTLVIIGQDRDAIDPYVQATGLVPTGVMLFTSIQELNGLDQPIDYGGGPQDAQALLRNYPHSALQIGLWMVGALDEVAQGRLDDNIRRLGAWITATKRPVYLRIGYECDFPANNYEPAAYILAFRHVVERLRAQHVDNVACVWHSFADQAAHPAIAWYPGDAYVDWVGVSYFDPDQQPYLDGVAEIAREHHKPLMIAESTPRVLGTRFGQRSWGAWFVPYFRFVREHDVQAISYINWDWETIPMFRGQGWEDARIQANEVVKAHWIQEMHDSRYLHASPTLFHRLGLSETAK